MSSLLIQGWKESDIDNVFDNAIKSIDEALEKIVINVKEDDDEIRIITYYAAMEIIRKELNEYAKWLCKECEAIA